VLEKITADYGAGAEARAAWNRHWIAKGFDVIDARLAATAGQHAVGDRISLADICLVPQVYNARRVDLDLAVYPRVVAADAEARKLPAFAAAAPEAQPDAPCRARQSQDDLKQKSRRVSGKIHKQIETKSNALSD
jgi:maleylpyruvate isomerase